MWRIRSKYSFSKWFQQRLYPLKRCESIRGHEPFSTGSSFFRMLLFFFWMLLSTSSCLLCEPISSLLPILPCFLWSILFPLLVNWVSDNFLLPPESVLITATQIQKETNSFLYKYKYSWKHIGPMKGVALIRGYPLQCADTNRQSPMHVDTTRPQQRKTLIFIGVSQRYFFARPYKISEAK